MASKASFVSYSREHFGELITLYRECFPQKNITSNNLELWILNEDTQFYLLFLDDALVGFIYISSMLDEYCIMDIGVRPGFRRQGFGVELTSQVVDIIKKNLGSQLFLEVSENNKVAVSLYTKLGFKEIRRRKAYYPTGEDAIEMKLSI